MALAPAKSASFLHYREVHRTASVRSFGVEGKFKKSVTL